MTDAAPTRRECDRALKLTPASSIAPRPIRWAWPWRVPIGELTLTAGYAGTGKSTFLMWFTAAVTRGTLGGEWSRPRNVAICAAEDSWDRAIVPRLIAAGADLGRVFRVDVDMDDDGDTQISLPRDLILLGEMIGRSDVAVVVVDPVLSFLSDDLDSYKSKEIRRMLEPLRDLADRTNSVVLGNVHFNKSAGTDPLLKIAGASAFGEVCRAALSFMKDDNNNTFIMSQIKNNLGPHDLPSMLYTLEPVTIPTEEGPTEVTRFVLGDETARTPNELLGGVGGVDGTDRDLAGEVILATLAESDAAWEQLVAAIEAEGPSGRTGERARTDLKKAGLIASVRGGPGQPFVWTLTEKGRARIRGWGYGEVGEVAE